MNLMLSGPPHEKRPPAVSPSFRSKTGVHGTGSHGLSRELDHTGNKEIELGSIPTRHMAPRVMESLIPGRSCMSKPLDNQPRRKNYLRETIHCGKPDTGPCPVFCRMFPAWHNLGAARRKEEYKMREVPFLSDRECRFCRPLIPLRRSSNQASSIPL